MVLHPVLTLATVYERLGIGWASSVLGFILVVFLPAPFLFYVSLAAILVGPGLTARSAAFRTYNSVMVTIRQKVDHHV